MSCSTCKTKKNINLTQSSSSDAANGLNELISNAQNGDAFFSGKIGRFIYFLILLICAMTPIINLIAMYGFYVVIYGKNTKKQKNVTKHTNTDETK